VSQSTNHSTRLNEQTEQSVKHQGVLKQQNNILYRPMQLKPTQPCVPPGSLNRVPALIGWGKGGNVTSAGWQVTLCDSIWHVSSRYVETSCQVL